MLKLLRLIAGKNISVLYGPLGLNVTILGVQTASCFVVYFILKAFLESGINASVADMSILLALLVLLFVIYYGLFLTYIRRSMSGSYLIVADLRSRLCDHMRRLPLAFFRKNDSSILSGLLLRNMSDAEALFSLYIYEMAACFIVPAGLGLVMAFMDWRIAAAMFAMVCIAFPFAFFSSRAAIEDSPAFVSALGRLDATLVEYLRGIAELKGAGRTGAAFTPYTESNDNFLKVALAMEAKFNIIGQMFLGALDLVFVAGLVTGTILVVEGSMPIAILLLFLLVSYRFVDPLQTLGSFLTVFRFAIASLKRIAAVLRESTLPIQPGYTPPADGSIEFDGVSFAYGEKEVLSGISFKIPEGGITALVGESGGGKTTIANLLLRFWDVKYGSVRVGGTDIRTLPPEDLYSRFSAVFQDVYLFNDTVMNNIRLARPEATDEEVQQAARLACCHEFIVTLENGYETLVGEQGSRLSGGERQRLAIARAILKNAPILILDEATASVDPENELLIQQGLSNLTQGKTLLVIAHRLTTIRDADQILVLRDGQITERGRHGELIHAGGVYKRLWDSQERLKGWRLV